MTTAVQNVQVGAMPLAMAVPTGIVTGRTDPAWYTDVRALWARPGEFFPTVAMTDEERLNAVVRLVAYVSLVAAVVGRAPKFVVIGLATIAMASFAHRFAGPAALERFSLGSATGMYGAAIPRAYTVPGGGKCTPPSATNPFMNPLLADPPGRPPACPYDSVADDVWRNFDRGLFKNVDDVYDAENGRHQYGVMPVTTSIPDTMAFAQFCYGQGGGRGGGGGLATCKEDPTACTPYFASRH